MTPFSVGYFPPLHGHYLADYHPYYQSGTKARNPAFDAHSQAILNLKNPGKAYFGSGYQDLLAALRPVIPQLRAPSEIVIIPSSGQDQVSVGLSALARRICERRPEVTMREGCLRRTTTIEKLSRGGDRSQITHLQSMQYTTAPNAPGVKILFDDVTTTGNSLLAAATLIRAQEPHAEIVAFVLGKTVHA